MKTFTSYGEILGISVSFLNYSSLKTIFFNDLSLFLLAGYALDPSDDTAHIEEK